MRAVASIMFALCFFVAIALLLFHINMRAMLNDEIYAETLVKKDGYQRIYTDVLTPENVRQIWEEVSGDAKVLSSDELQDLLRAVAPPDYLQAQTEANLALLSSFAAGESEDLELYLEMAGPLDRLTASLVDLIEVRIEQAPVLSYQQVQGQAAQSLGADYSEDLAQSIESLLADSNDLASIADLTGLTEEEILEVFDQAVAAVLDNTSLDIRFRNALEQAQPELRQTLRTGNTRDMLKQATRTAVAPAMEVALEDFRARLDEQGRLALVPILANEVLGIEEAQLQAGADRWQQRSDDLLTRTLTVAVVALAISAALLAAIHWGRPKEFIRWFYRMLISGGGASLAFLIFAYFALPFAVDRIVAGSWMNRQVEVEGIVNLVLDIVISLIQTRVLALMWLAGGALALGIVFWAGMFAWERSRNKKQQREQTETDSVTGCYPGNGNSRAETGQRS